MVFDLVLYLSQRHPVVSSWVETGFAGYSENIHSWLDWIFRYECVYTSCADLKYLIKYEERKETIIIHIHLVVST